MPTETNSQSIWDEIWSREGGPLETWRQYPGPFGRIVWLLKNVTKETQPNQTTTIVDLGCGVGVLLNKVWAELAGPEVPKQDKVNLILFGIDLSQAACEQASNSEAFKDKNVNNSTFVTDLEHHDEPLIEGDILLCTEALEHLTMPSVHRILAHSKKFAKSFFMVPNYCLGPEDESQHLRKWSAKEFLDLLKQYHKHARVEVFYDQKTAKQTGHRGYLLGVCGYKKETTLSFTMPVKDEEDDIERVLASFRGVSDEIVIGIDDKSSDATEEIANRYADKVFQFTWEDHFSKARNQCIDQCTSDWVFMSEGHEHLHRGAQALLQLDEIPDFIDVLEVKRESYNNSWYFPWLFRNLPNIRFQNAVHNTLSGYPEDRIAKAHQISTWHERSLKKSYDRMKQRNGMNKQELLRRITQEHNIRDMFYLGTEYLSLACRTCKGHGWVNSTNGDSDKREMCPDCTLKAKDGTPIPFGVTPFGVRQAMHWWLSFITSSKPCVLRYQARLNLAKMYWKLRNYNEAKKILSPAIIDDATRIEHWYLLGEICEEQGQTDLAMRFYEYAALGIGRPPMSYSFLDKAVYTYLPAQKLTNVYAELQMWDLALDWARKVPGLLPHWAPPEALEQAEGFIKQLEEKQGYSGNE